jgi:hypothetical protein
MTKLTALAAAVLAFHGAGCLEINGSFYLNGKNVPNCRGASHMDVDQESKTAGKNPNCNGKPTGHTFVANIGGKPKLAVCR